jgi:acetolactate synthase-1/2/3 large subunit
MWVGHGGKILVEALKTHGVDHVFCVPGESYLPVLDALYDSPEIALTVCRQEGGAAMMADAYGKLTGRPGICFVTRGPGATNASAGVHIAFQDSTPMILFIGQVRRGVTDREAFQEIDYRRMFGQLAKWVAQIDDPARIPEYLQRAFTTATSGRPGPVVLALPEDVLQSLTEAPATGPYRAVEGHPSAADLSRLATLLEAAERPFMILGGSRWSDKACADIMRFAEAWDLPVGASFRCQDLFDNEHPNYAGDFGLGVNPKLAECVRSADLLLVIGARLGEITTSSYRLIESPRPRQHLVHVFPAAEELGRVYQADLPILSGVRAAAGALAEMAPVKALARSPGTRQAHQDYLTWSEPPATAGELQMGEVITWLRENLPADAILCNGAGNYTVWVNRFYRYRRPHTILAPTAGSMGYGMPAAVAAKRLHPERLVIAFAGDGCFMMTGQELATAVQYGANIIIIVINNSMYGTIRMHQERRHPGRISGTTLRNPDFAALAQAYGAFGETVRRSEEFAPAFERALAAGCPALLELQIDPEVITPHQTLLEIRTAALASR